MGRRTPYADPDYKPYYDYIRRRDLHLQRCASCGLVRFPLSPVCHACFSTRWEWQASVGRGRVTSWVVFQRQYFPEFPVPYIVVQVEMDEGPRLTANLLRARPEDVCMGLPVSVAYEDLPEGDCLLQFVPASAGV